MEPIIPPLFIETLQSKHLLLDTNLFLDAVKKPTIYTDFFTLLKKKDITLATIDLVKYELLKGSIDIKKYKERMELIDSIINVTIPISPKTYELCFDLIKLYGIEGSALKITDLFLGVMLMQFRENIFLITRDTSDFLQTVFDLKFVINIPHTKGILTYGIYQYSK